MKRFLESQPAFPKDHRTGEVRYEEVVRLMRRPHYAGYIEVPDWDVSLRKGHHDGLISLETFQTVQRRIKEDARAPARKDISADFPLRGFVLCADYDKPLTACWSNSKTGKKHPYYMCFSKGCASYCKSIRRGRIGRGVRRAGADATTHRKLVLHRTRHVQRSMEPAHGAG